MKALVPEMLEKQIGLQATVKKAAQKLAAQISDVRFFSEY